MSHCVIIARSSTDRHDVSCKSQIAEITTEVKRRGESIIKVLEFPRIRHSDFLEDPDFKDILCEAQKKDRGWNKIWFYDTSRLSRNRMKAQITKAFFRRHGIEIEFLKIPKTGEEALDNVIEGILETFDQLLSDSSRAGSIRGQKQNIRSGYRAGGRAPYGYQLKKHSIGFNVDKQEITKSTLEPHPAHFPILKEYLERRAQGEYRGSILRDFEKRKIESPSGKPTWLDSTCNSIEKNLLVYCGHLVYNRHNQRVDGKYVGGQKFRPEKEWEVHHNTHTAAITEEQAEAIKAQLKKRHISIPKPRTYLLTGQLYCGICKGPMVGDSGYYVCIHKKTRKSECTNSKISSGFIDKRMIGFAKDKLLTRVHFQNVIEETKRAYREEMMKTKRDGSRLKVRLVEIDEQLDRLMNLYERGNISSRIIEQRVGKLEMEREDIQQTLEGDQQFLTAIQYAESELDDDLIKGYVDRFEELLNDTNVDLMREFIKTFVTRIDLWGREGKKRRGRKIHIHGQIPAFTGINLASPIVKISNQLIEDFKKIYDLKPVLPVEALRIKNLKKENYSYLIR